jgi:transcriptional regulator with XRE-family HTH domain
MRIIISYYIDMKKNLFTHQVSKKFKSLDDLPEWVVNFPSFQNQIKSIRKTLGMTQEQLGKLVNRSLRSIQKIEAGHGAPKISTLTQIANALNTELKILLIPRQDIDTFLESKASIKAEELVEMSKINSALEIQTPTGEEVQEQIDKMKREILEKKRDILWNQIPTKK